MSICASRHCFCSLQLTLTSTWQTQLPLFLHLSPVWLHDPLQKPQNTYGLWLKNKHTIPVSSAGSQTRLALPLTVYTCQELKEVSCNYFTKYRTHPATLSVCSQPLCHLNILGTTKWHKRVSNSRLQALNCTIVEGEISRKYQLILGKSNKFNEALTAAYDHCQTFCFVWTCHNHMCVYVLLFF